MACPMPTSRRRRTNIRSTAARRRGPRQLTAGQLTLMRESARAEAEGDPVRALASYQRIGPFRGSHHGERLRQLVELEGFLPPWVYARWVLEQAVRHSTAENNRRCRDVRVAVLEAGHVLGVDPHTPYGYPAETFVSLMMGCDWLYRQAFLFEDGGLRRFLDTGASAELLARAEGVAQWVEARMGGYRMVGKRGGVIVLDDLGADCRVEVLDVGSVAELDLGDTAIGRIVPIGEAPGAMFESRPMKVDGQTARAVAADPSAWLAQVRAAHLTARLPEKFSWREELTLLAGDVPELAWRVALEPDVEMLHRRIQGGDRARVEDALRLLAGVLGGMPLLPVDEQSSVSVYAGCALMTPGVIARAREDVTLPQTGWTWRHLAERVAEPARSLCLDLARRCDAFGREVS